MFKTNQSKHKPVNWKSPDLGVGVGLFDVINRPDFNVYMKDQNIKSSLKQLLFF